jgi:peptide chain release factor 1
MIIEWEKIQKKRDELTQMLTNPSLDHKKRNDLNKELSRITVLLEKYNKIEHIKQQISQAQGQIDESDDPELQEMFHEEIAQFQQDLNEASKELDDVLYPPDEHDNRSVFVEIRSGAGGKEAALFVADLMKMYTNYALKKGWRTSISSVSMTDLGGFREVVLHIEGKNVYGHLKKESGVHRVQRVPVTETAGRVHTSTATVAVLPEAKEVDVSVNPADLRIDVYRASGAGGQHVNTTDSAVRITHIPTGVVVACQDERSQHKNKAKALKILKSRILAARMEAHEAEMSKDRKSQVGAGMRAEKIRTYNYPQNRVTDHQVNLTLKKLDIITQGDLDEIVEALMQQAREERKKQSLSFL